MSIKNTLLCLFLGLSINGFTKTTPPINSKPAIVFDVNGVLVFTNASQYISNLGLTHFISYAFTGERPLWKVKKQFQKRYFEFLDRIPLSDTEKASSSVYDEQGTTLPKLMTVWLNNLDSPEHILKRIDDQIKIDTNWFVSKTERLLIKRLARSMFTPKEFANGQKLNPHAVAFIKQCKAAGFTVRILSNFEKESFKILQEKYPELFNEFNPEDIIISGDTKYAKPFDQEIYNQAFSGLDPHITWFIDDQEINLEIPKQMGVNVIHFKGKKLIGFYTQSPQFPSLKSLVPADRQALPS